MIDGGDIAGWLVFIALMCLVFFSYQQSHSVQETPVYKIDEKEVACNSTTYAHCGAYLNKCDNGIEYKCMTNLERIR